MRRDSFSAGLFIAVALLAGPPAVRAEPPPNVSAAPPAAVPAEPTACDNRLSEIATFTRLPPVSGPGECGGEDLLRLEAVIMPDRSRVALRPAATLRCSMAEAVAEFLRQMAGPAAAAELGAPLAAVASADSYDCRNRNRQQAARISEHARANALDIGALELRNHRRVSLTDLSVPLAFRRQMRDAACRWFTTVLGPGSDAYHNEHIHLDRAERSRGYRLCQWEVRETAAVASVPLPLPRPKLLDAAGDDRTARRDK